MSFRSSGKKRANIFICELCDFKSNKLCNYNRHLQTIKHKRSSSGKNPAKRSHNNFNSINTNKNYNNNKDIQTITQNDKNDNSNDNKSGKNPAFKYICEKCDFKSNKKTHYNEHLQTKKHNDKNDNSNDNKSGIRPIEYECVCGKTYKFKSGLSRHKQYCTHVNNTSIIVIDKTDQTQNVGDVLEQVKSSVELDMSKSNVIINIHTGNNIYENIQTKANTVTNTTNNKTFSVKNYLNNDCKDAYNVSEVIDNFECDILKLPKKTMDFYKCLIDKAFEMETEKLPIRCSDVKRKKFFGKEDSWNNNFDVIEDFIKKLVDVVCDFRNQYSKRNPGWHDDDIVSNIMNYLIRNVTAVYDDVTCKHIISYIAEKTKILK